jgi:predicted RNA-binding Zn ribbon-like protein
MVETTTLVAGPACLELVNTINNWHDPRRDALAEPETAEAWAAAVLDADVDPLSDATLEGLRGLRRSVREIFRAVAAGTEPRASDLASLADSYRSGLGAARLGCVGSVYAWAWTDLSSHITGPFADDAIRLLRDGPLERVGECPGCGWLFLDTSKNARRTWCSMRTCGARDKAKRYYRRTHPRASGADTEPASAPR